MASYDYLGASSSSATMYSATNHPRAPPRPRPASRRSTSSYQVSASRPSAYNAHRQHHRTASSSSTLHFGPKIQHFPVRTATPPPSTPVRVPPAIPISPDSPRFSRLLTSVLGSPFLTTSDLPWQSGLMETEIIDPSPGPRPSSPVSTVDFSIIDVDMEENEFFSNSFIPGGYPHTQKSHQHGHGRSLSSSMAGLGFSRGGPNYHNGTGWGTLGLPNATNTFASGSETKENQLAQSGSSGSPQNPLKALLPRIWDVISSPGRAVLNFSPSANLSSNNLGASSSSSPSRTPSPSPRRNATAPSQSWYHAAPQNSGRHSPVFWNTSLNKGKGKSKASGFLSSQSGRNGSRGELNEYINYSELPPLDGEEGELIDDEACFIDVRAVTGIDILTLLPPELALHILTLVCPPPLNRSTTTPPPSSQPNPGQNILPSGSSASSQQHSYNPAPPGVNGKSSITLSTSTDQEAALHTLLACRAVSHTWRRLASDNAVWRALFLGRWGIDLKKATPEAIIHADFKSSARQAMPSTWNYEYGSWSIVASGSTPMKGKKSAATAYAPATLKSKSTSAYHDRSHYLSPHRISYALGAGSKMSASLSKAPLQLDWRVLYREHLELDNRWAGAVRTRSSGSGLHKPTSMYLGQQGNFSDRELEMKEKENIKPWEPQVRRINGHTDSVYCLEFDSRRIMTGSRDRTVRVWSLKTGKLLGTFRGAHKGSVLCLKFSPDWDRLDSRDRQPWVRGSDIQKKGFLVTGSSDCSVCVWDLELGDGMSDEGDREVKAEVRAMLKGHEGGVLDLKMDDKWIVSCSKDASIRVWDRRTLELHRTLRGHEGPVNAVGFQNGKVVSASGDGKMILWDIASGERLRTFEGHDRGLACIEFKDNLIVSGSNDCKIKVWDAWTGECLRTLVGHEALVRALNCDPRTGRLVSASYDKTVKVWDLRNGNLVREFKGIHTSHIFDVKFDVARIVTTSHDHQIVILDFSTGLDASLFV